MHVQAAELFFLDIPFRVSVTHGARSGRSSCDSVVLAVSGDGNVGYGEAVVRDYVSGSLGTGKDFQEEAARFVSSLLASLRERDLSWLRIAATLGSLECEARFLPLVCAVETALLDLAAAHEGVDVYDLLGRAPVRAQFAFGAVFPMIPLAHAKEYLGVCAGMGFSDIKVKVGSDRAYNEAVLGLCRAIMGSACDIRVDANGTWAAQDADAHLEICARHGVRVIEQPFAVSAPGGAPSDSAKRQGFLFMADEAVLTPADVASIAADGSYQMLNLRLSKNGGLLRVLDLASAAEAVGLTYQLGCMVGETGILSALGRVAASLLPHPVYLEGGYDDVLLSANVTTRSFGFGSKGTAGILRGKRIGYEVDPARLSKLSMARQTL
jgi:L-alanine-DL-glutamate epimerase-like enolase superfamily enzyme